MVVKILNQQLTHFSGMNDTNVCNRCKFEEKTIYHLLCPVVQNLISTFYDFFKTRGIITPRDRCNFISGLILQQNC